MYYTPQGFIYCSVSVAFECRVLWSTISLCEGHVNLVGFSTAELDNNRIICRKKVLVCWGLSTFSQIWSIDLYVGVRGIHHLVKKWKKGRLLFTGHLSWIGTLLLPVKSIDLFKTLFFLPCVPESLAFLTIKGS